MPKTARNTQLTITWPEDANLPPNRTLADVLEAKGHDVEFTDFVQYQGQYDRIVMNPPFESGADIDQMRHAFECLAPGGRLVSVMSEGPFFRSDTQALAFRTWLDELGGTSEELPDDAFRGVEAFQADRLPHPACRNQQGEITWKRTS